MITIEFELQPRRRRGGQRRARPRVAHPRPPAARGRGPDRRQGRRQRPAHHLARRCRATGTPPLELSDVADRILKERLQRLPGVGSVFIGGERRYAMRVWLDPQRMAAHGLTAQDVERADPRARTPRSPAAGSRAPSASSPCAPAASCDTPRSSRAIIVAQRRRRRRAPGRRRRGRGRRRGRAHHGPLQRPAGRRPGHRQADARRAPSTWRRRCARALPELRPAAARGHAARRRLRLVGLHPGLDRRGAHRPCSSPCAWWCW